MVARLDKDQRELIRRLFAVATMIASEAEEIAVKGQSPKLSIGQYKTTARQLLNRAEDLATVAGTIEVITR